MDRITIIILSLLTGVLVGGLFAFFRLPIPAPLTFSGICGIFGIYLGYKWVVWGVEKFL